MSAIFFIFGGGPLPKKGYFSELVRFDNSQKRWQPCLVLKKTAFSKTLLFELFCRECQLIKWDALKFSLELFVGWHEMRWAFLETKMNCLFRAEAGKSEKVYSFFAWTKFCIHNIFMKYIFLIQVPNHQLKNGVKFPSQSFSFVVLLEKARVNHFLWHLKFFKKWSRSTLFLFLNFDLTRKYSYPLLLMWWSFQRC